MFSPVDVLAAAFGAFAERGGLPGDEESWLPSGCAGWAVRDLVFPCLSDAQRGLVALHTPAAGPAGRDAVTYWADPGPLWLPGGGSAGLPQPAEGARMDADPLIDAATAARSIDRLSARVHLGLGQGRVAPRDVVELACALLDWGHSGEAVREAVERDLARVPASEVAGLARRILEETGFDPGFDLAPERLMVLRQALGIAARDLPTAGITGEPRLVLMEDFVPLSAGVELADSRLLVGDAGLHTYAGDTLAGAVTAVADLLQTDLIKRTWRVWPLCPEHQLGLHPMTREDAAVWWCAEGSGHVAARVGELANRGRRHRS